jgi:hypothetical protein
MKTLHAVAAVAVLATVGAVVAVGADTSGSRPPGVSAQEWTRITDTLGVVLDQALPVAGDSADPAPANAGGPGQHPSAAGGAKAGIGGVGGAVLIPPISGYLMMRRGNLWQRVILVEPVKGPGAAG